MPILRSFCSLALLVFLAACERPPSGDLKEWTPADHDRAEEKARIAAGAQPGTRPVEDKKQLIELTWKNQCAQCHGTFGKGDGPNAPMVKPPDLTRAGMSEITDAQLEATIKNGKGKMPKFELPDELVKGLIARIRESRGK